MRIPIDKGQQIRKYTTAIKEKISNGRNVEEDSSMPRRVISSASASVGAMARIIVQPTRRTEFGPSTR